MAFFVAVPIIVIVVVQISAPAFDRIRLKHAQNELRTELTD